MPKIRKTKKMIRYEPFSPDSRLIKVLNNVKKKTMDNYLTKLQEDGLIGTDITLSAMISAFALSNYKTEILSSPDGTEIRNIFKIKDLRYLLENLIPNEQCKIHMPAYFETNMRTVIENAFFKQLADDNNHKYLVHFKKFVEIKKLSENEFVNWVKSTYETFEKLSVKINEEIKKYVTESLQGKFNIPLDIPGSPSINFYVCNKMVPNNPATKSDYYNPNLALYGIYNVPNNSFNLGTCWLCETKIAIFLGFGTLVKHQPQSASYGIICSGSGECEHVLPIIDAAKFGALSDRIAPGISKEYYPSHTHCNQVKNDAQLWYKNIKTRLIQPDEGKIKSLLNKIKFNKINKNEYNENLLSLIDKNHNSVDKTWVTNIYNIVSETIDSMAKTIPNFKAIANTLDNKIEATECFINMAGYIILSKLQKEQKKQIAVNKGGGISIEEDKIEIKKILGDPNIVLNNYDVVIEDSNNLNNIFNKIILLNIGETEIINYIESEISNTSLDVENIKNIFLTKYYQPITNYDVNTNTKSYAIMKQIIENTNNNDYNNLNNSNDNNNNLSNSLVDELTNDSLSLLNNNTINPELINIETINTIITNINFDLVNTLLANLIVKFSNMIVIINNYVVYITDFKDIRNYDETKYVEIIDKHFIYNGISYNVQDVALCKVLIDGKKIIPILLQIELSELKIKNINNILEILDDYNQIADISRNSVSDPTMITDAINEQKIDIENNITELEKTDKPLANVLSDGLSFLLENFNIDYQGPIQKSSSERLETTLETNVAKGLSSKQRTLTLEQIQNYINNNKSKFLEVCNVNLPVELDKNGNICQNINGEQIKINTVSIMNIIKNDLCKEYSNISYDSKSNRLNCTNNNNNNIGGKTKKKYNNLFSRKKKYKKNIRRRTKNRPIKHKKLTRKIH